jgi:hypothetical protein
MVSFSQGFVEGTEAISVDAVDRSIPVARCWVSVMVLSPAESGERFVLPVVHPRVRALGRLPGHPESGYRPAGIRPLEQSCRARLLTGTVERVTLPV